MTPQGEVTNTASAHTSKAIEGSDMPLELDRAYSNADPTEAISGPAIRKNRRRPILCPSTPEPM